MDTPPPPLPPPNNPVPPPVPPVPPPVTPPPVLSASATPPPVAPSWGQGAPPPAAPTPVPGAAATDRLVAAFKNVDWQQMGKDSVVFAKRFAAGDFALIHPAPAEQAAVAGQPERMASLIVWRRALLFMAAVVSVVLIIKSCFEPRTFRGALEDQTAETLKKTEPNLTSSERHRKASEEGDKAVKQFGEANIVVANTLLLGQWGTFIASAVFQILAALHWRRWRLSRKYSLFAVLVILLPMLVSMIFPWSSLMDFSHLNRQFAGMEGVTPEILEQQAVVVRAGMQSLMALVLLLTALPFFYGLFNGILRATLTAKTLVPASIVCGWSTLLMALTISVPWFCILTVVAQFQADAIIVLGVICLVGAPLSLVLKSRRLGAPLHPAEATPVVKRARLLFTGLNIGGVVMLATYLLDKKVIGVSDLISPVLQYFANLMLITVVGVDMLSLLLERAHMKLAADPAPEEPLRQLGEVLHSGSPPGAVPPPVAPVMS